MYLICTSCFSLFFFAPPPRTPLEGKVAESTQYVGTATCRNFGFFGLAVYLATANNNIEKGGKGGQGGNRGQRERRVLIAGQIRHRGKGVIVGQIRHDLR